MATNQAGPPLREPRVPITTLVKPESRDWLDTTAHHHHLTRNDVVRVCLAVARKHGDELANALAAAAEAK